MRYGFAKILKSNESGYSGNTPDQRGKFVLVPRECYRAFPHLSQSILNDQSVLKCILPDGSPIGLNIVYHNAKFFPTTHQRAHDEVRIYRNIDFERGLSADRGVFVVFLPILSDPIGSYALFSIQSGDAEFDDWRQLDGKTFDIQTVSNSNYVQQTLANIKNINTNASITNLHTVAKQVSKQRKQQQPASGDPGAPFQIAINSQEAFKDFIRDMYGYKCCLRNKSMIDDQSCIGLTAAHIKPHAHGGPLLPTNGILLSNDLHAAYDKGAFTLNQNCTVEINRNVPSNSDLRNFDGFKIQPMPQYNGLHPYIHYIDWHRNNVFIKY